MPDAQGAVEALQPLFSHPRVRARMSLRVGGVSRPPYDSLNMAEHVGDDPRHVRCNRERFAATLGMPMARLRQVHGADVVTLQQPWPLAPAVEADASATTQPGLACEVQVADCLPVLLADRRGRVVAAAHAGWRGLAAGVLEAAVQRCMALAGCDPWDLEAWLGPCIGPDRFEVGVDVLQGFGVAAAEPAASPSFRARDGVPGKWWADLPGLARTRLQRMGVQQVTGNDGGAAWCTVQQASHFFSFRRDRITGRMSAAVGLLDGR